MSKALIVTGGSNGMGELVDGEWRECHIHKRSHLEAHGVGIEYLNLRFSPCFLGLCV